MTQQEFDGWASVLTFIQGLATGVYVSLLMYEDEIVKCAEACAAVLVATFLRVYIELYRPRAANRGGP